LWQRSTKPLVGGTEIESTATIPERLDSPEMAYQVRETFFQNWRKVLARSRNQCTQSSRVRRYNKSKKGWQKSWKTVCKTTTQGGEENSGV